MSKRKKAVEVPTKLRWHAAPLKGSFMVLSILGFLVTMYIIYPNFSKNLGIALMIVFAAMFVASLISMTKAPVIEV